MKCILEGHAPQIYDGHGTFVGQKFWVCQHCGRTEPYIEGRPALMSVVRELPMARTE